MEQQEITPLQQFTYQVVVGSLARDSSQIAYNSLKEQSLLPANENSQPNTMSSEESQILNYSVFFSDMQYSSELGRRELGMVQSNIEQKFGGLEALISLPENELSSTLAQIQRDAIKSAYSKGLDGTTQLTPQESALMYVTNGGDGVQKSLHSIESMLNPELSGEDKNSIMSNFGVIALSDMYARALRAEQIFGVNMISEDGQLNLPNYSTSSSNTHYKDAA
ncbi:MAG: hypothetical protein LAT82_04390 [Nanoarchaeota archaeon]|nr:hypothetical protein [Nanoarchaeota archaeon]